MADEFKLSIEMLSPDTNKIVKAVDNVIKKFQEADKAISESDDTTKKIEASINIAATAFTALGVATKKLFDIVRLGVEDLRELENSLVEIKRIGSLTQDTVDGLGLRFQRLAIETGVTATEIAKFGSQGARFGIRGEENIANFAETMARLGAVTGTTSETMTRELARISNLTGANIGDFDKLASTVVALGNSFPTTEEAISRTSQRLAQDLAQFDASTEFVLGLGAAMDAVGINAERGGTAIQKLTNKLIAANAQALPSVENLAREANLNVEVFQQMIDTAPDEALIALAQAGVPAAKVMSELGENSTRARAVFATLSTNTETLTEALQLASKELKSNATLMEQSALQAESLDNVIKRLTESQKAISAEFGKAASEGVRDAISAVTELFESFSGVNDEAEASSVPFRLLGEQSRELIANITDLAANTVPALAGALEIASVPVTGMLAAYNGISDAAKTFLGFKFLEDEAEAYEAIIRNTEIMNQKIEANRQAQIKKNATLSEAEKLRSEELRLAKEIARIDEENLKNYDSNSKKVADTLAEFADLTKEAEIDLLDGLAGELASIEKEFVDGMADLGKEFGEALAAAEAVGDQSSVDALTKAYNDLAEARRKAADAEKKEALDKEEAKVKREEDRIKGQVEDLKNLSDRGLELIDRMAEVAEVDPVDNTAITSLIEAFEADVEAEKAAEEQRKAQAELKEANKKREKQLGDIKKEMADLRNDIKKGTVKLKSAVK